MEDLLILVDEQDAIVGYNTKMDTHRKEQLHRAFSLFLYNKENKKMLLHQRAIGKYHSGGLWTNSCCSHPRKGEELREAVIRRTKEELGLDIEMYRDEIVELGKFQYYEKFDDCAEHEIDHVFFLAFESEPELKVDADEIGAVMWLTVEEIKKRLKEQRESFTAWFLPAFEIVLKEKKDWIN